MRNKLWLLSVALIVAVIIFGQRPAPRSSELAADEVASPSTLQVGAVKCEITLPIGAPLLSGFDDVVREIGHPLFARVLYLRDAESGETCVIVAMDALGLVRKAQDALREEISRAAGVPREQVVINASHTHSGAYYAWELEELLAPAGYHVMDVGHFREILKRIGEATALAKSQAEPVRVSVGMGQIAELTFNRRLQYTPSADRPKYDVLRRYPQGVTDPTLGVVRFDRGDGTPVAILCNLASHATVYAPKGVVSASFPGVAMQNLETEFGESTVALFLQGCAGNISPGKFWPGQSLEAVERAGQLLTDRIQHILQHKMERLPLAPSRIAVRRATLPFAPLDGFRDLDDLKTKFEAVLAAYRNGEVHPELAKFPTVVKLGGAQSGVLFLADRYVFARELKNHSQYDLFAWNYGPLVLAVLPGESFVDFALEIRDRSHHRLTLLAAYNDSTPQYIPDPIAFEEGGYEPGPWCYSTPETGPALVNAVVDLVNGIPAFRADD